MSIILSIVGYSKSGKTTLLEKMIPILKSKGFSVGVVKHSGHEFPLDHREKDTYRLGQSGAEGVALVSSGQIGFYGKIDENDPLILDRLEQSFFFNWDIVLTEGFKKGGKPKIAVLTKGKEDQLLKEIDGSIVATVGESPVRTDLPHFQPKDAQGLVDIIVDRFLKDRNRPSIRIIMDGKNIPMNSFVQEMVQSSILGLLSPLKGFKESQHIDIKINPPNKGVS